MFELKSEHESTPRPTAHSIRRHFAAMFAGAYVLLLIDSYADVDWIVLLLGALVVALGVLGFPAVERQRN